jgi:hypothetical protein
MTLSTDIDELAREAREASLRLSEALDEAGLSMRKLEDFDRIVDEEGRLGTYHVAPMTGQRSIEWDDEKEVYDIYWECEVRKATEADEDLSQKSYSYEELANFTHEEQVKVFNWCGCEDNEGNENPYNDCPKEKA